MYSMSFYGQLESYATPTDINGDTYYVLKNVNNLTTEELKMLKDFEEYTFMSYGHHAFTNYQLIA